jgi:vesicle-associated membrane protein 7
MEILYAAVVFKNNQKILADHSSVSGNFREVVKSILDQLDLTTTRLYVYDGYLIGYSVDNTYVYVCLCKREINQSKVTGFLASVRTLWNSREIERADFPDQLKAKMDNYNNVKILQLQDQIEETRAIMADNIDHVIRRGEKLEVLIDKTEELENSALLFKKKTTKLKWHMCLENYKMMAILVLIVILVLYFLLAAACGFDMNKCK